MPDIITSDEAGLIAAFLASNPVTKCPPRYAERVQGGAIFTDGAASTVIEKTPRQRWSEQAEAAKARKRIEAGKHSEAVHENRCRVAAMGRAVLAHRKAEAKKARLGKILRHIGDEWTTARVNSAAAMDGTASKVLRAFLRGCGYGDKLPGRVTSQKHAVVRSKPDTTERDAGICADYVAMMPNTEIAAKWHIAIRTVRKIVQGAGIPVRQHKRGARSVPTRNRLAERSALICAAYDSGAEVPELAVKFDVSEKTARKAITGSGRELRNRRGNRKPRLPEPSERDRQMSDYYLAGHGYRETGAHFGCSKCLVSRALRRCGTELRDTKSATAASNAARRGTGKTQARIVELAQAGMRPLAIAKELGHADKSYATKVVQQWKQGALDLGGAP